MRELASQLLSGGQIDALNKPPCLRGRPPHPPPLSPTDGDQSIAANERTNRPTNPLPVAVSRGEGSERGGGASRFGSSSQ